MAGVRLTSGSEDPHRERPAADAPPDWQAGLAPFPDHFLNGVLEHYSKHDDQMLLTHGLAAVAWTPEQVYYAASSAQSLDRAKAHGLTVLASISYALIAKAISVRFGSQLLANATWHLKRWQPSFSAHQPIAQWQKVALAIFVVIAALAMLVLPGGVAGLGASLFFSLFFVTMISIKLTGALLSDDKKRVLNAPTVDDDLPVYSILVPLFRETSVVQQLLTGLTALTYPAHKLDIKLIVEEGDIAMRQTLADIDLPAWFEVLVVPPGKPQTKPRALNFALQFARGNYLTIYDAEDIPEPDQLLKAVGAFASGPENLACLQAELAFYNSNENWLTRQFTVEYATLFRQVLPRLAEFGFFLPLSGTSNHFKTSVLREVGGWDPFNVTEDADLGLRLARSGWKTSTLDSMTHEEATTELGNWINQRARWLKGFLQTWFVHMRHPIGLWREIGFGGFWVVQAMTIAVVVSAALHPVFLILGLATLIAGHAEFTSLLSFIAAVFSVVVVSSGYGVAMFAGNKALASKRIPNWTATIATLPAYWLLIGVAGWLAVWQFATNPHHWNKTRHGLSRFMKPDV